MSGPDELRGVLAAHARRYPLMRPTDAVKLIFQNEFGGGHLIADPAASLARLRAECAALTPDPGADRLEAIGNGIVRVNLRALDPAVYPLEALNDDFVRSAAEHTGSRDAFLAKLALLREVTAEGLFAFDPAALEDYLRPYIEAGCPPVSHSPAYRAAYQPAYRVVLAALARA